MKELSAEWRRKKNREPLIITFRDKNTLEIIYKGRSLWAERRINQNNNNKIIIVNI